jgi:low affinity Fe/Cu permease
MMVEIAKRFNVDTDAIQKKIDEELPLLIKLPETTDNEG